VKHWYFWVGLAIFAALWLYEHDHAIRMQALAEARADSLRVVTHQRDSLDLLRAQLDSQAHRTITVTLTRMVENRHVTDSLTQLKDSLVALDSLRPALAVADSIISTQRQNIVALVSALSLAQARWQAADSAAQSWRAVALNAQVQLGAANKRASPGLLKRVEGALPYLAAAYLAGRFTR
jgi:hypothetical protein